MIDFKSNVRCHINYTLNPSFYLSSTYGCDALKYFNVIDFVFNVNSIKKKLSY